MLCGPKPTQITLGGYAVAVLPYRDICRSDYFDKPSNFWSLAGMKDALTKLVGLCSLNTQEAKAEKEEPNQETKKDEQVSLDGIRL